MSALAKPMFHTAAVTNLTNGVSPMVNAERVTNIEIIDIPQSGSNSSGPAFAIKFTMAQDLKTGIIAVVTWKFVDRATLDTEYTKIVTLISTVIA